MHPKILMVGTRLDGQGGVASVMRTWQQSGLMERWGLLYVPTNGPGGHARKTFLALRAWWQCARLIFGRRVQLVHVHTSSYSSFWRKSPIFAIAIATRRPLIVSLHGGGFRDFYAARSEVGKAWIRLVMRRAERFVVLTSSWKRWVEDTEARSRVVVIPNPVPELPEVPELAVGEPAPQQGASDEPTAMPLLLFLGRIEQEKGIFVLLEALAKARRGGASWRLVCGGTGHVELARKRATELGLSEDVARFIGWVDGDAKRSWLRACDMLALPSFTENMPVVLLEAFAYRKPVVATRVGGIPDMVQDGVEGFLCPPGDVDALANILVRALQAQTDLKSMGAAARAKAEAHYTPEHVIEQVEAIYRALLPCTEVESAND